MEKTIIDLENLAQDLKWSLAGVTSPEISETTQSQYQEWLEKYSGQRLGYMQKRKVERLNPKEYFPGVKSILCFGLNYFPGWAEGEVKISNYSWGEDYHEQLKRKISETVSYLEHRLGEFSYRICVDTSPVLEKILAAQSGIGWQGKNTLILNQKFGSMIFLGELFTSIELDRFKSLSLAKDRCGNCTKCLDACPTQALDPYVLKVDKCIAYWNLEHRGPLPTDAPKFEGWLGGCDICQQVCPWNHKLEPQFEAPISLKQISAIDAKAPDFANRFQSQLLENKAMNYLPLEKWKINLAHLQADKEHLA